MFFLFFWCFFGHLRPFGDDFSFFLGFWKANPSIWMGTIQFLSPSDLVTEEKHVFCGSGLPTQKDEEPQKGSFLFFGRETEGLRFFQVKI